MPNLVGIWNPDLGADSISKVIEKQLRRVRVPQMAYQEWKEIDVGFGAGLMDHGILENGTQPVHTEDGRYSLLLDGELYNTAALKLRFRNQLPSDSLPAPELVLRLWLIEGQSVLRLCNGLFCMCLFDRVERRLTMATDRFGFRPLYYVTRGNTIVFGSEIKALCAADPTSRQIDAAGTLELFCYGSHMRERTWIDGYRRLPPATIMTVDEKGAKLDSYWTYRYREDAPEFDQPTYYTVYGKLLDRAVERCMQGSQRKGIFLSGGYDSRAVAAAIQPQHKPMPAFTFGQAESRDIRFAKMLADRLGLDHFALTDTGPYLYPNCRSIVWRTEGMIAFANTTSIRFHSRMKERMDVVLTGFLGEFGGSHTWPQLLLAVSRDRAIRAIYDRFLGARLPNVQRIFQRDFFTRVFEEVRSRFKKSFDLIENNHPFNIADCWNVLNLQPRSTYHAPSIDRHLMEMRAPMMDAELIEFLLTIPPKARLEQRVYKKMIAYSFPEIREVPCTNSGLPINPNFATEYAAMAARYAARKSLAPVRRLLRLKEPLGREFRDLNDDFRAEPELLKNILRPLLEAGTYPDAIFDRAGIEALLEEQFHHSGKHENIVALLISWGLAAKYFLHDDFSDVPPSAFAS
jgi:asparagine synthase (glutamine-hydrolysing)